MSSNWPARSVFIREHAHIQLTQRFHLRTTHLSASFEHFHPIRLLFLFLLLFFLLLLLVDFARFEQTRASVLSLVVAVLQISLERFDERWVVKVQQDAP